jgi:Protein of unknown function (DUF3048) N-terminal domain/Protein of unknown function (DUF3048) C-terminal domain
VSLLRGRRGLTALAAVAVAALPVLLSGCSGGSSGSGPGSSASASVPTATSTTPTSSAAPTPVGLAPLTGLPVTTRLALDRQVVGVAVSYVPGAATAGLSAADVVYQEFDRAGHSRLVALYQSTDAVSVGPVTATAPVDLRLLELFRTPAYAFAGGATGFVAQVKAPAVTPRNSATSGLLFRVGAGGLVISTARLRSSVRGASAPLGGVLTFASAAAPLPTSGTALHRLTVLVPGQAAETFTWTGSAWAGPGGALVANVILQTVGYKTITPHKSGTIHSAQVVGNGPATVVAGQHAAAAVWLRRQPLQVTSYTVGNIPLGLAPGRTWVLLVPLGTQLEAS